MSAAGTELDLAARVVELTRQLAPTALAEVLAVHSEQALTRFANSAIHQNVADATTTVALRVHLDGRTASGSTTVTGTEGLRSLVGRILAAAKLSPPDPLWAGLTPPSPVGAHPCDEATAGASPALRAELVRAFVDAAGGLETAGFCRTSGVSGGFVNSAGQSVAGRTAEAALDGIARLSGADGIATQGAHAIGDLDATALGALAAAKARAAVNPAELPPGRYEVVLEPSAVADLLGNLANFGFNGKAVAQHQSFATVGAAQFDPAITITDEPLGVILPFDQEGTPRATHTLVDAGTTRTVTHDRTSAAMTGATSTGHASEGSRTWGPVPANLHLAAAPAASASLPDGPAIAVPSARPLVAAVERGLLISDLWYTRVLDQKSLAITGLTRNGVWLVENGEIAGPVGNMRFTQSYPQALQPGAVRGIGSIAHIVPDRWIGTRYTTPALHLASWNLTGNASG